MCIFARSEAVRSVPNVPEKDEPSSGTLARALDLAKMKTQSMMQYRSSFENRVGLMLSLSSGVTVTAIGLAGSLFAGVAPQSPTRLMLSAALILMLAALFFEVLSLRAIKGWVDSPPWDDTYSNACLSQNQDDYASQCAADMKKAFATNRSVMEKRAILLEHGLWLFLAGVAVFAAVVLGPLFK